MTSSSEQFNSCRPGGGSCATSKAPNVPINTIMNKTNASTGTANGSSGLGGGKSQPYLNNKHNSQSCSSKAAECFGCHKPIHERYLLRALDQVWHEDCLKCSCCNCRLGEVGSTLFTRADLILCKRDYLRMFGTTGFCSSCNKQIPAFEMVMRARGNVYHLECFKCEACSHRFCVGDRFYLHENRILCEYDYEEQMAFSHMQQQQHNPFYRTQLQQSTSSKSTSSLTSQECALPESEQCQKSGKSYCPIVSTMTFPMSSGQGQSQYL